MGAGDSAADDDKGVEQRRGVGDGVAGDLAHAAEGFTGGVGVALGEALGDFKDHLGFGRFVERDVRQLGVDAANGANRCALFGVQFGVELVAQDPDLAGERIVAGVEFAVAHDAAAESGAERDAEKVAEALRAAGLGEEAVDVGQQARGGFAEGEQVAVVVDKDGQREAVFEDGGERDVLVGGQIAGSDDDAVEVVGWRGEGEADRRRRRRERIEHALETLEHVAEGLFEIGGSGGQGEALYDGLIGLHGGEDEVRPAGVERHDGTLVV